MARRSTKERLYVTQTDHKLHFGGKTSTVNKAKTLPWDCCAISIQKIPKHSHIACPLGFLFDKDNIIPFVKKYKEHPVAGTPLTIADLFPVVVHENEHGKPHCPVTLRLFTPHSKMVAVRTTGNLFTYEAVKELNIKTRSYRDLIDDTPFEKSDIIIIQDPADLSRREVKNFTHIIQGLTAKSECKKSAVNHSSATERIMEQLRQKISDEGSSKRAADVKEQAAAPTQTETTKDKQTALQAGSWQRTTGKHSASFTSTAMTPTTVNEIAPLSDEEKIRRQCLFLKAKGQKGYVQLETTEGVLNIELHVDITPRTCINFLGLAAKGFYDKTPFHRIIRNFMVQGGDPSGTGSGGESLWGRPFPDEIAGRLTHSQRGILSMANSGPDTNGSQFFILFKSAPHLDAKHTVFGRVVGGLETLDRIECVSTDSHDKPRRPVALLRAKVLVDPAADAEWGATTLRAFGSESKEGTIQGAFGAAKGTIGAESVSMLYQEHCGKRAPDASKCDVHSMKRSKGELSDLSLAKSR